MSDTEKIVLPDAGPKKKKDDDIIGEYRQEVTEGDHGLEGDKSGISTAITFIVALSWSLFQMSTASWLLLDSLYVKAFHLAFAMALVFLNIPAIKGAKRYRWDLRILLAMNRVTLFDWAVG
ncbi:MAG: TRAP transporter permease, partial [Sutterella sp.]|nr:TRAP transporter permease [Sutterella sp.]